MEEDAGAEEEVAEDAEQEPIPSTSRPTRTRRARRKPAEPVADEETDCE